MLSACSNNQTEITNLTPEAQTPQIPPPLITQPTNPTPVENNCTWIKKREFECDEVIYISGLPSCPPYHPKSIFCKKEFENNFQACFNDNSPETQKCHFEKIGRYLPR